MLDFNSINKYHILVILLIIVGLILYVNNYFSTRLQFGTRKEEVKTIHNKCDIWTHKNCKGKIPTELCNAYKNLNPEKTVNCKLINKKIKGEISKACGCSCLKNFSEKLPVWPINSSINWDRGKFSNVERGGDGDYMKIIKSSNTGKWVSPVRDWFRKVKYAYLDTDSEVSAGKIKIKIEVSNDDFENVRDSTTKILSGGTESFGLCNLSKSRYLRININLKSRNVDKELTTLHGIWLYINKTKPIDESKVKEKYPED